MTSYCEREGILPQEQCGFRPQSSMVDIMFMVRHLRTGEEDVHPLFMCFDDPTALMTSYDSVDRTLL